MVDGVFEYPRPTITNLNLKLINKRLKASDRNSETVKIRRVDWSQIAKE